MEITCNFAPTPATPDRLLLVGGVKLHPAHSSSAFRFCMRIPVQTLCFRQKATAGSEPAFRCSPNTRATSSRTPGWLRIWLHSLRADSRLASGRDSRLPLSSIAHHLDGGDFYHNLLNKWSRDQPHWGPAGSEIPRELEAFRPTASLMNEIEKNRSQEATA